MTIKNKLSTTVAVAAAIVFPISGGLGIAFAVNAVPAETIAQAATGHPLILHLKSALEVAIAIARR
ncbi:hypothetical protein GWO64_003970 [Corynebacterium macginleyi]|uniref:hypothetical protein n=1 Tax=Corynebacterium macginleyi TaxID=38290 RepID=UPI00190C2633|nr:hypothetical protein [Corynebacterium macginleyi]QRJ58537.1 hypothetical protein GWO64_003970 [Corynebacterium macginleyi]